MNKIYRRNIEDRISAFLDQEAGEEIENPLSLLVVAEAEIRKLRPKTKHKVVIAHVLNGLNSSLELFQFDTKEERSAFMQGACVESPGPGIPFAIPEEIDTLGDQDLGARSLLETRGWF